MYSTLSGWPGFCPGLDKMIQTIRSVSFSDKCATPLCVFCESDEKKYCKLFSDTLSYGSAASQQLTWNCGITHRTCAYDAICQIRWELTTCYYTLYLYCCVFFGAKKRKENYWMINKLVLIVFFFSPFSVLFYRFPSVSVNVFQERHLPVHLIFSLWQTYTVFTNLAGKSEYI